MTDPDDGLPNSPADNGEPPVRQKQIAELLGLSTATVSRALRNDQAIGADTRARVFAAAEKLGYRARTPRSQRPDPEDIVTLQLLVGEGRGPSAAADEMMAGISSAASQSNVHLSVFVLPPNSTSLHGNALPPAMRAGLVHGAILLRRFHPEVVADLAARFPVLTLVHRYDGYPVDRIDIDSARAVRELVAMLRGAGHERIGFVAWGDGPSWEEARFTGYCEAHQRQDHAIDPELVLRMGSDGLTLDQIAARMRDRLQDGVTAWICSCDPLAYDLRVRLRRLGVEPGQDLTLAGYDGIEPPAGDSRIPTVRVPYRAMGIAAVRRLLHRLQEPDTPLCDLLLHHELVADDGRVVQRRALSRNLLR